MIAAGPPSNTPLPEQRRRQLAQLLREKARQSQAIHPASTAQRGVWLMQQMDPAAHVYNLPFCVRVLSAIDPACAKSALEQLIDRHPMLRATFRTDGNGVEMLVQGAADADFEEIDATGWTDEELKAQAEQSLRQPFDLRTGPLVRLRLFSRGATDHLFLLVLHHIVCDGSSLKILLRDFMEYYYAASSRRTPQLPPRPLEFPEFVRHQEQRLAGPEGEQAKAFWLDRLSGELPRLDLPKSHPAQDSMPVASVVNFFEIEEPLCERLNALARSCGVTLFGLLLAAYQTLMMRLTGQEDILVGVPMAGRIQPGYEELVGHLVNLVAIRGNLGGNPSFREVTGRIWRELQRAIEHQEFPFSELVRLLRPSGRFERYPLFRTCLNILKPSPDDPLSCMLCRRTQGMQWGRLTIAYFPVEAFEEQYDLAVRVAEMNGRLHVKLQYDSALFSAELIEHFTRALLELLGSITENPDLPVSRLAIMTPGERDRILNVWNDTAAPFPADRTVHALFREQAQLNPGAIAIEDGDRQISYGELNSQADAVAAALIGQGVRPGDAVAISLPRSAGLIAGILGILKAGAAYVPLDASYPAARRELMLRESGATAFIGEAMGPMGPMGPMPHLSIDDCLATPAGPAPDTGLATDAAYIMFTSGSTGVPKGVRVLHRGISRLVINTNFIAFTPADVVGHGSNTSFDGSTFEIWGALLHGARLVIIPKETLLSPQDMAAFIRERNLSVLFLATPLFHHFALEIPGAFATLRSLVIGGDALGPQAARAVLQAGGPAHLINGYGPTEVTAQALYYEVADVPPDAVSIPIGRPISNTRAYILDPALEPVPAGIAGEIYLGGPGVAGGYLNNPGATAACFLPDPFSADPSDRLYKTGDLARWREDGVMEFLGRADTQVKIRGFRVEPGEVETALLRHPHVRQAIVIPRTDSSGHKQLAAYLLPQPGQTLDSAQLRAHLLGSLPDYMTPSAFAFLDALPLSANGKIDLAALSAQPLQETTRAHESPGTWMETALVEIWEKVLDRQPIGVTDDFFDLGGHSLLAIRMLADLEKRTGIKIAPRILFEEPTIRHLALSARRPHALTRSALVPVQTSGSLPPFFFLHGDFVEGGLYCVKMARHIGTDRPFYAIDPHGVHDESPPSIEEMAAQRLELVRQVRPHGPYVLGGFCNGGLVAFEMARQLEAAGETVSSLVLLSVDGSNSEFTWLEQLIGLLPAPGDRKFRSFLQWRDRILFARAVLRSQLEALAAPVPLSAQPRRFARKLARISRKALGLLIPSASAAAPTTQPEAAGMDIGRIYHEACSAYVPRPYRGPVHVLWPDEMPLRDAAAGWGSVMSRINLIPVPGGHFSSLQGGNLFVVSEKIRACLLEDEQEGHE